MLLTTISCGGMIEIPPFLTRGVGFPRNGEISYRECFPYTSSVVRILTKGSQNMKNKHAKRQKGIKIYIHLYLSMHCKFRAKGYQLTHVGKE